MSQLQDYAGRLMIMIHMCCVWAHVGCWCDVVLYIFVAGVSLEHLSQVFEEYMSQNNHGFLGIVHMNCFFG